jgi:uncharacterized protein YegL
MDSSEVHERIEMEEGQLVMPFYLICDVSSSMTRDMHSLNDGVSRLQRAIVAEPVVDDVAQISILTFSTAAHVALPLGQMSEQAVPVLSAGGGTNYGAAFRCLADTITSDVAALRGQGYKTYRPCAFFLTDGEPGDRDWHQTFTSTLTYDRQTGQGMKAHPIFVPFGFRDAHEKVLGQLAYPPGRAKWYHTANTSVEAVLKEILDIIMKTVIQSGKSAGTGQPLVTQQAPNPESDMFQGESDYNPDYVW